MERVLCILIGYAFGCFLTAEAVARRHTGKGAEALGTGNPGTANITVSLGLQKGALVLLGDVLKTVFACGLGFLLFPGLGRLAVLYAGLGTALGHNFPFWKKFRGGRGVAVTCTFLVLFYPGWGILSCLIGLAGVLLSGYLVLGGILIPLAGVLPAFWFRGPEAGVLVCLAAALMFLRNLDGLDRIVHGREKRVLRRHSGA